MNQYKLDKIFIDIADNLSKLSHCVSFKVACVAVKDGRIISTGINGTPNGMLNCDDIFVNYNKDKDREKHYMWSNTHEIHAEMNVILFCAKHGISLNNAILYCTHLPCQHCMKNLLQAGIKKIIYKHHYDKAVQSQLISEYMKNNNIEIIQYNN